jgi:UDP-GlcNAc:undecaprenyl-phosphate GlcNAc-1-phosphate transferase
MGDSGALLLGFTLAAISVEGLLKTASLVSLFLPLAVLAVPVVDTTFVVAKRLKHGLPVFEGDRSHLHHRFLNIGYSQRRAVLTIYAWCGALAAAALATRFMPPRPHGDWQVWPTVVDAAIGLLALAFSIYVVYLLEIVKLANPYIRRREQVERRRATA